MKDIKQDWLKAIEKAQQKHKSKLAAIDAEFKLLLALDPMPEHWAPEVYVHEATEKRPMTVDLKLWKDYNPTQVLKDARDAVRLLEPMLALMEEWDNGCRSIAPKAANYCSNGSHVATYAVTIEVQSIERSHTNTAVVWWITDPDGGLVKVKAPIANVSSLMPRIEGVYDRNGDWNGTLTWKQTSKYCEKRITWGGHKKPSATATYCFATVLKFASFCLEAAGNAVLGRE